MSIAVKRLLCLWAGLLVIVLCYVWLPAQSFIRGLAVTLVLLGVLICLSAAKPTDNSKVKNRWSDLLPPAHWAHPVILVLGDESAALFAGKPQRLTAAGLWLPVASLTTLLPDVQQLLHVRPGWRGQISVLYVVNPQQHHDMTLLTSTLRELRHQIAQVAHLCQHNINLVLTSYLYCTDAPETWFW
ncbi:hypothetical protein ACGVWS_12465, partial [Enterobacteriaceae bacterium LUAb1]